MQFKIAMLVPIMIFIYSLILHNTFLMFLLHLLCFYTLMFHKIIVLLMFVLTYTFEIWTRMGDHHPQYPILEVHYDKDHRAKRLSELQEDLVPLRLHTHQPHCWDEHTACRLPWDRTSHTYSVPASLRSSRSSALGYRSSTLHFSLLLSIGMIWYTFGEVQIIDLSHCLN